MTTTPNTIPLSVLTAAAVFALTGPNLAADPNLADATDWSKPKWLSDLSVTARESYDDNVLLVSGLGLPTKSSWVSAFSLKLGLNFVPLLGEQKMIQTFSLVYQPEVFSYDEASAENYTAHRINTVLKGRSGNVSFSFDNAFLYNDGSKVAPTYALNQLAGAAANQNDKFRNNFAHSIARERRNQIQDRYTAQMQVNSGNVFFRPVSSLTFFDLNTDLHNTASAPYKGYQDYVDRYDLNGGADFGYKASPDMALTLGYRYGYQYQQQFPLAINADRHFSSGRYQRLLVGVEGKLTKTLTMKLAAGPDFRDYGAATPINNPHTDRFYGEAALTAAIAPGQSLAFNYKQWIFVASTGLVPYEDIACTFVYHLNVTKALGFDLGIKRLEANYTMGNEVTGGAPSLRDDVDWGGSVGLTYALTAHLGVSATYNSDTGKNEVDGLAATLAPDYRVFNHQVITFGAQYKF